MGLVLSASPVAEYDKRLVVLTKEYGKITMFARGARRQNSMLMACSSPFTFGYFTIYKGRNSYNLMSAQVSNYFVDMSLILTLISLASLMVDFLH